MRTRVLPSKVRSQSAREHEGENHHRCISKRRADNLTGHLLTSIGLETLVNRYLIATVE